MTRTVFALLVDAHADEGCEYPIGTLHHLLVLVSASNREEAENETMLALSDMSWRDGRLKQVEAFGVPLSSIDNPVLRSAAEKAFAGARSIIVYPRS